MNERLELNALFKVKSAEEDALIIEGYASTTNKDRMGDVIIEEAWTKGGLNDYLKNPIILANHDYKTPIGKTIEHSIGKKGLKIVAEISKSAGNIYDLVKEGILKTLSVGFSVKDADYDSKTDIFVIKDLDLLEISVVSVPANSSAIFSVRKSLNDADAFDNLKQKFSKNEEEIDDMSGEALKELEAKLNKNLKDAVSGVANSVLEALEAKALKEKEEADKIAKAKAAEEARVLEVTTGAERLVKEAEERIQKAFEEKNVDVLKSVEDLTADLKEKDAEIKAMQKSKMSFKDKNVDDKGVSKVEKTTAVLLSKIMTTPLGETKFGIELVEKTGLHLESMSANWEQEFRTDMQNAVRERLVIEPLFRTIAMNTPTMHLPINPEAAYGEWIAGTYPPQGSASESYYGNLTSPVSSNAGASTGTAVRHALQDTSLTAHKLVSKEYIAYEEEEDSIIPLIPIIQDAIIRRMGKSSDKAILIGAGSSTADPITGICTAAAATGGAAQTTLSIAGAAKATVSGMQTVRRGLGVYGTDPKDVIYVVSNDVYYDLLEDDDFRTTDLVGEKATILRGQIGDINGSPVIISGEFATKAASAHAAVALNTSAFIVGTLRSMMVERGSSVIDQNSVIVASRRMAFKQILANTGVSVLTWAT